MLQHATLSVLLQWLSCTWGMAKDTPASSSPTTSAPTVLTSSLAGLSRLSQEDITQIATAVAGLIRPPPLPGTELSSSSNPLQVLGCVLSSEGSSSSLVPTPPSLSMLQSRPGTKFVIGTLGRTYRIECYLVPFHMMRWRTAAWPATLLLWKKIQEQCIDLNGSIYNAHKSLGYVFGKQLHNE